MNKNLCIFKEFVNEMLEDNSRTHKIAVLNKYKKTEEEEDIKYFLDFVYNPYIITGISSKKLEKAKSLSVSIAEDYEKIFEYLKTHNTGTDSDLSMISRCRASITTNEIADLFDKIITKNLQLGVEAKTINKVFPKLIPQFEVALANKYFDNPEVIEGKEFAVDTKIDGSRIIALKKNNKVTLWTRQGQPYEGLVDIEQEILSTMPDNICLDGELTLLDPEGFSSKDQYKETMKISRKDGEKHGLRIKVFDYMTADEFESQTCRTPYCDRRKKLEEMFSAKKHLYLYLLPILYRGTDPSQIIKWLDYNTSHGEEGVMVKVWNGLYKFGRSNEILKVKKFKDVDLKVVGFEEGTNKNIGTLGALLVKYKDNNIVKVGSGFSDELRKEIWNNQDIWLNRVVTVKYFEETTNADGGLSLRFPVYVDYRTDKSADF